MPSIVGGLDIHRKQIIFDYLDAVTGEVRCGQVGPADRAHFRSWLARFEDPAGAAFAVEACTGWRYVAGELQRAGMEAHLAEPADTAAARGRKRRAKTDRADARLQRELLMQGRLPELLSCLQTYVLISIGPVRMRALMPDPAELPERSYSASVSGLM